MVYYAVLEILDVFVLYVVAELSLVSIVVFYYPSLQPAVPRTAPDTPNSRQDTISVPKEGTNLTWKGNCYLI
jgi:hypothetical protein